MLSTVLIPLFSFTVFAGDNWKPDDFGQYTDMVDRFHKASGNWVLAAAGSNGVPPPYEYCVIIEVIDLNKTCNCILNTVNHTVFSAKIFKIIGINERNRTRIHTTGPVIPYTKNEEFGLGLHRQEFIYSTACWDPKTHTLMKYHYVLMLPEGLNGLSPYLFIVGTDTRSPNPEIQIALLSDHKAKIKELESIVNKYNVNSWRYYYEYDELLPDMAVKCASDEHNLNMYQFAGSLLGLTTDPYPKVETVNTKGLGTYEKKYLLC